MPQPFPEPIRSERQYFKKAEWNKMMATFQSTYFYLSQNEKKKKDTGSLIPFIPLDQNNPG